MKMYKVEGGTFRIGIGEVCQLTDAQIQSRAARNVLTIMQKVDGGVICRANAVLDFKSGETLGLAATPPKNMSGVISEVVPPAPVTAERTELHPAIVSRQPAHAEPARSPARQPGHGHEAETASKHPRGK